MDSYTSYGTMCRSPSSEDYQNFRRRRYHLSKLIALNSQLSHAHGASIHLFALYALRFAPRSYDALPAGPLMESAADGRFPRISIGNP